MYRHTHGNLTKIVVALLILGGMFLGGARPTAAAQRHALGATPSARIAAQSCSAQSYWLPSMSILRLQRRDGATVDLKRNIRSGYYTVHIAINGRYQGERYVPVDIGPIQVRMALRLMTEVGPDGRIRQVYKEKPLARACSDWSVSTL